MSTIKKALKKLGLSGSKPSTNSVAKTVTRSLAAKSSAKPAAKKVVKAAVVKAATKKAMPAKTLAKPAAKAAPVKGKPVAKAAPIKTAATKLAAKSAAPIKAKVAPGKMAAPIKAAVKPTAAPVKTASSAAKPETKPEKVEAKRSPAPAEESAPKAAKPKKSREEAPSEPEEEIILLDADGRRYCRVRECDQASAVDGYCRFHYLLYWKNIQVRKAILTEGKLERYIEDLTARYPDKYLEMLKKDLRTEKDFLAAIQELEIDESSVDNEYEDEAQNYLDEVRGMSSEAGPSDRDEEF